MTFMTDNGQAERSGRLKGKRAAIYTAGFKTGKGSLYESENVVANYPDVVARVRQAYDTWRAEPAR